MLRAAISCLIVCATPLCADENSEKTKNLLLNLQGKWKTIQVVKEGKKLTPDEFEKTTVEFKENRMISTDPREKRPFTVELRHLDLTKSPIQFEMKPDGEDGTLGILELKGDTLQIAVAMEDVKERPTKFEGHKDVIFVELKRIK